MLMTVMSLAMAVQDPEAAIVPGACRTSAERFIEASPRIRQAIQDDASSTDAQRGRFIDMLESDSAVARRVLAQYRAAATEAADISPLDGLNGSQQVDYMRRCDAAARLAAMPPRTPGACKAAATLGKSLSAAMRGLLIEDRRLATAGKPAKYDEPTRNAMLGILDQEDAEIAGVLARYNGAVSTAADTAQAGAMSPDDRSMFLVACTIPAGN